MFQVAAEHIQFFLVSTTSPYKGRVLLKSGNQTNLKTSSGLSAFVPWVQDGHKWDMAVYMGWETDKAFLDHFLVSGSFLARVIFKAVFILMILHIIVK